ncbi:hypothetical protein SAMN02927937_02882 [Paenimyroides aquimaris]|uniref:Lipoprotein n=1 Tax=Paenimyroides marinum TaxID=1159016 RepID=A0A1H6MP11_9FLAO|nr:hypothetical protein [Paenimyroides aquimaris]SEI03584.1 hypothetical protein SAMN02927937_02882 [Paenimyroides aquimaris]
MKRTSYLLLLLCIITFVTIYSCSKEDTDSECNCEVESTSAKLKIGNNDFDIKLYQSEENPNQFISINTENINSVYNYLNNSTDDISSLVIFSENIVDNQIDLNNINGFIVYKQINRKFNKKYEVNIFKKNKEGGFIKLNESPLYTYNLSTNNFGDVNKLYFNSTSTTIHIFNPKKVHKGQNIISTFQKQLEKEYSTRGISNKGPRPCGSPCNINTADASYCEIDMTSQGEVLGYRCFNYGTHPGCLKEEADEVYDSYVLSPTAYSFRDDYLDVQPGGDIYTSIYYSISTDFIYSNLTYSFAEQTATLLESIVPKIQYITENPYSSTVLFSSSEAAPIKAYLTSFKSKVGTTETKDKIDFLINKINSFENKSCNYITSNLATEL